MTSLRILLLTVVALTLTATVASAQRATVSSTDVSMDLYNQCCDEIVHFELTIHDVVRSAEDNGGGTHFIWNETASGFGTSESGTTYRFHEAAPESHRWSDDGRTDTYLIRQRVVATGGSGCSFTFKITIKSTMNANGTVTASIQTVEFECDNATIG